jgi:G protein-coupled receptor GPR1
MSTLPQYSYHQAVILHAAELTSSALSVLFGILGIVMWVRMSPSRRVLFRLKIFLTLIATNTVRAAVFLIITARRLSILDDLLKGKYFSAAYCDTWGYLLSTISIYSDICIFVLTLQNALVIFCPQLVKRYIRPIPSYRATFDNLYKVITFKRSPFRRGLTLNNPPKKEIVYEGGLFPLRKYILFASFIIGALLPALVFIDGEHYSNNNLCGIPILPVWKRLVVTYGFKYFNVVFIVLVYVSIMTYLRFNLYKIHKAKRTAFQESTAAVNGTTITLQKDLMYLTTKDDNKRKQVMLRELKTFAIYPLGYIFVWTVPLIVQIWNYSSGNVSSVLKPLALVTTMSVILPMTCTIDTIIFLIREKPWAVTEARLAKQAQNDAFGSRLTDELSQFVDIENDKGGCNGEVDIHESDANKLHRNSEPSFNDRTLVGSSRHSSLYGVGSTPGAVRPLPPLADIESQGISDASTDGDEYDNHDDSNRCDFVQFLSTTGP